MISAFIEYLKIERNFSPHTIHSYAFDLNQCADFLNAELQVDFQTASFKQLRYWLVYLSKSSYSPRSINRKIASVKSFYKFCSQVGLLKNNPANSLKSLKTGKTLPDFYSSNEMDYLLSTESIFSYDFFGLRDRLIMILLFSTGIRQAELISLKWNDFDYERKQVKILGKRNKERYVYLTDELITLFKQYKVQYGIEVDKHQTSVFLTNKNKILYPKFVYRKVNHYLSFISKGRKKSPHVLRHSFATELMNNDVEINSIKEVLGHSSLSATEVYTHNSKERMISEYKSYHPRGGNKNK